MRVLHIVENFDGQAIESWLSQLYKEAKTQSLDIDWDFYCLFQSPGKYSGDVLENDGKIICSPYPISSLWLFMKNLRRVIIAGEYDVLHCHQDIMSGLFLLASIGIPIKSRVVHIHNTSLELPTNSRLKAFLGGVFFKWICLKTADYIVGVSKYALAAFTGSTLTDEKSRVLHCGVDFTPYADDRLISGSMRSELNIPGSAKIILFVGRMTSYKNPIYVAEILNRVISSGVEVYAVFSGVGPEVKQIVERSEEMGVNDNIRLLGRRDDIPHIMNSCDVLICPSSEEPKEGLGLVIIEAQAAGLKVLMSMSVPEEAVVIPELVTILPLTAGLDAWGKTTLHLLGQRPDNSGDACVRKMCESSFSISNSLYNLQKLYR